VVAAPNFNATAAVCGDVASVYAENENKYSPARGIVSDGPAVVGSLYEVLLIDS
jgi:hypothetical protein